LAFRVPLPIVAGIATTLVHNVARDPGVARKLLCLVPDYETERSVTMKHRYIFRHAPAHPFQKWKSLLALGPDFIPSCSVSVFPHLTKAHLT
jgi:hypothetical protein